MAERMADGAKREEWFNDVEEDLGPGIDHASAAIASAAVWWNPLIAAERASEDAARGTCHAHNPGATTIEAAERAGQTIFLRDIFGNPFQPITINPSWLTSTVLALAQGIYSEKAFDRMPILANTLQGADLRLPPLVFLYRTHRTRR
jgi:hypothetical protein